MDWMKIAWALCVLMMVIFLLPNAKRMLKEKHEVEKGAIMAFVLPILVVVGFVALLIMSVR